MSLVRHPPALLLAGLCFLAGPASLAAQQTALKTVPIATGDQFLLVPARSIGMAGVSVAVRDTFGDPWENPAAGARVRGGMLFAAPGGYTISEDLGAGLTLTAGGLGRAGDWFGGVAASFQQLDNPNRNTFFGPEGDIAERFIDGARDNAYVQFFAGRRFGARTSAGFGIMHADMTGIEGVNQLYAGSASIAQEASLTDYRLGVLHRLRSGVEFEAIARHSRLDALHEVGFWNFVLVDPEDPFGPSTTVLEIEENRDRTNTTALQLSLEAPLADPGTTLGVALTASRKLHPKIPNYRIANIPRDPGNSTTFAATVGVGRRRGPSMLAMELSWLPARSHTWGEAEEPIALPAGGIIPAGGRTVENWFRFSNFRAATGFEYDAGRSAALRLGFGVDWYRYRLRQERYIDQSTVRTRESWIEWSPTWGFSLRPEGFSIQYNGKVHAKGFPFDSNDPQVVFLPGDLSGVDFLPPVTQPVTLPDYTTWTHQIAIIVPLGR